MNTKELGSQPHRQATGAALHGAAVVWICLDHYCILVSWIPGGSAPH